ncbi:type VI secretion system baseplate subunit TssF [Salmonella enterica subsp. enterica]|nr:type VI secretion system baseplate subunit TssF [Salmonella enterica subsp. enterica]
MRTKSAGLRVFSVEEVEGTEAETTRKMIFRPLYHTRNNDEGNLHGRYFSLRREPRRSSKAPPLWHPEPLYRLEVFLSLVDQHEALPGKSAPNHHHRHGNGDCRDLPCLIHVMAGMI